MGESSTSEGAVASPFTTNRALRHRVTEAVLARAALNNAGLNAALRQTLGGTDAAGGALFAEPIIEAAAGYETVGETLANLSGSLLRPDVVAALTGGAVGDDYRFDPELKPYTHQLECWRHLTVPEPRSVLVSSGTGSGKTECFLVPLLNDLADEAAEAGRLSGVRAIMLYPLNALIASQQERLRHWTAPFKGRVRFGLYNGLTDENVGLRNHPRQQDIGRHPEEAPDRKTIRNDPPPILVTNVTMLEYMIIRAVDRPLVRNSAGKLRWIIIDEAHSYIGSSAAEIALLLRRVLHTFGVKPADVRFVATSATIGNGSADSRKALQRFLSDLAGVEEARVHVVEGRRAKVELPPRGGLAALDAKALADRAKIDSNAAVQSFVRAAEDSPLSLDDARRLLAPTGADAVKVLEAVADDRNGTRPLLPLRVHQFMRTVPGLWSCLDPGCSGGKPAGWPFGALAFQRSERCRHCTAPVFELESCWDCGEVYLGAFDHGSNLRPGANPPPEDEFAEASDVDDHDEESDEGANSTAALGRRRLLAMRQLDALSTISVETKTGAILDRSDAGIAMAITRASWDLSCPHCRAKANASSGQQPVRPLRFGAPFLVGNAAPVALDGVQGMASPHGLLPGDGRRLLSFTDSRQGTARFAANLETTAERSYVRSYVYHAVQKSLQASPEKIDEIAKLRGQLADLEDAMKQAPAIRPIVEDTKTKLLQLESNDKSYVAWSTLQRVLAHEPITKDWIRAVWHDRDDGFRNDYERFAGFLLLRELARRPRRANALETLGMARLRYDRVENVSPRGIPGPLERRGRSIEEWRDFLYILIDNYVRGSFALDVSWADVRWLLPRGGIRRNLVGPNRGKNAPGDLTWPAARTGVIKSNPVLLLEMALGLDSASGADRAELNEVLAAAWDALRPLFETSGADHALDLGKATLAPVEKAWLCPVTRRVLTRLAFGRTPFGHREGSPLAQLQPTPITFPKLPICFPREAHERAALTTWLNETAEIQQLRALGAWRDLHDRAVLFSPYIRAEEHSAQQPPARLRAFEKEFRDGKINILACSTTMEMGVDIGSVSSVLMTNVPPSIANYRQRVGRAGRRGQGFSNSLTLARDTPLERETFQRPVGYLRRQLEAPRVKLDAPRIVQRHVNALLLATWFAKAGGELHRMQVGAFLGYPEGIGSDPTPEAPVEEFCGWTGEPSIRASLADPLKRLTSGTALDGDAGVFFEAETMFREARSEFERQWRALQGEAEALKGQEAARKSIEIQLKRLCRENLLKELANRTLLPGHGFPTSVVPFINDSKSTPPRETAGDFAEARTRRYEYPCRNADTAIREYAPGADVVIDGLVWQSAGVTLNWQRPAHAEAAKEIQSLRYFWECRACGAADCTATAISVCPGCGTTVTYERFLEPAGFRVDWNEDSHADSDRVAFVPPRPVKISARDAEWRPLLKPALGRGRSSHDGLVFYSAAGAGDRRYRICLECGRAEEAPVDGSNPLADHRPLRGGKRENGTCAGAGRPFAVTEPILLGHEVVTDVAELQPAALRNVGAAWALASSLREALARRLAIEPTEMGMGVAPRRNALEQDTHSVLLFDQSAGGAGFATRLFDDLPQLLEATRRILDCQVPGCERGCAACVLTADLFADQEIVDRRAALECVDGLLEHMRAPDAADMAVPDARLSAPVADCLVRQLSKDHVVALYVAEAFDLTAWDAEPFVSLLAESRRRGSRLQVVLRSAVLERLDPAQRQGLRDAAIRFGYSLWIADPSPASSGAAIIASRQAGSTLQAWFSRDPTAGAIGTRWGLGQELPVVCGTLADAPAAAPIGDEILLPKAGTHLVIVSDDKGRSSRLFGNWFVNQVRDALDRLGLWRPGELISLNYSDRYVRSPLTVLLALSSFAALRDPLAGKGKLLTLVLRSAPLVLSQGRTPFQLIHDWQRPADRAAVVEDLGKSLGLNVDFDETSSDHARELRLTYSSGATARLLLDQGFGYWRTTGKERFDFAVPAGRQAKQLEVAAPFVFGRGNTHIVVTKL